jgi:hypothetical protein
MKKSKKSSSLGSSAFGINPSGSKKSKKHTSVDGAGAVTADSTPTPTPRPGWLKNIFG